MDVKDRFETLRMTSISEFVTALSVDGCQHSVDGMSHTSSGSDYAVQLDSAVHQGSGNLFVVDPAMTYH